MNANERKWKKFAEVAARVRVPAGFALLAVYVISCRPTPGIAALGAAIALLGILLRGYAAGHLAKNESLAVSGPYAYTRNPLYIGSALVALGFAIAGGVWWLWPLFALFLVILYLPVVGEEEAHLAKLFPGFHEYAASVPRFIGWRRRSIAGRSSKYRWSLYWRNQEYNASLGYVFGMATLLWKLWQPR